MGTARQQIRDSEKKRPKVGRNPGRTQKHVSQEYDVSQVWAPAHEVDI